MELPADSLSIGRGSVIESALSETTLGHRPTNNYQFLHHFES